MKKSLILIPLLFLWGSLALPCFPAVNLPAPKTQDLPGPPAISLPDQKTPGKVRKATPAGTITGDYLIRPEQWGARADADTSAVAAERNRAAIQAAIDYGKGGRVQLSAGTYVISKTIYLRNNVSLCGVNPLVRDLGRGHSAIFLQSNVGGPMIQATTAGVIQGLILCPAGQKTTTIGIYTNLADHVHNLTVDGCMFYGFKGTPDTSAMVFDVLNQSRLTNNFFLQCNQSIRGYIMDSWITGNEATGIQTPGSACMKIKGGNLIITENIFYSGQFGLLAEGTLYGDVIAKNSFADIGTTAFPGYGIAAMGGSSLSNCSITGNTFGPIMGGGAGILIEKGDHNAIYGNVFRCKKAHDSAGVQLGRPGMVAYADNNIYGNVFGDVAVPIRIFPYPGKDPYPAGRLGIIKNNVGIPDQ